MSVFTEKLIVLFLLVMTGMTFAGVYGAIHNQISYSVSPEYFTRFKFEQFNLESSTAPDRFKVSVVGFKASWWMGFPIGLLIGLVGFIHNDSRTMARVSIKAMLTAVVFTFAFSICGLMFGFLQTRNLPISNYQDWYIPPNLTDLRRFVCASYMHNSAYLGGTISIVVAWIHQIRSRFLVKAAIHDDEYRK